MNADAGSVRRDLVLIGGGEHARVVLDAARSSGRWNVIGFTDPGGDAALAAGGVPHLGGDEALNATGAAAVIAVGGVADVRARARIAGVARPRGGWASVVHASAVVAGNADIGDGAVVLAAAIVNPGARIGTHVIVNSGAVVEHDVVLGELSHVGPAAAIGGGARIGARVLIGLGARIRDHVTVGDGAVIGMGAVVVGDVEGGTTVVGVPARVLVRA
jgi:acetyltransferase EpsM